MTNEYTYGWRYIGLNGLPSDPETPLSSPQLEQVLDFLEQAKPAAQANSNDAAHEVIAALARSLEATGVVKATDETTVPSSEQPAAEQLEQPMRRWAQ